MHLGISDTDNTPLHCSELLWHMTVHCLQLAADITEHHDHVKFIEFKQSYMYTFHFASMYM